MFSNQALKKLIIPLMIEQFLAVMVGMADITMVSAAGEAAVSSVALVDLLNVLILNIFAALATGGAVVCAQSIGAEHLDRANRAARQLMYILAAAGLAIMALVLLLHRPLLGLLFGQVEPAVMEGAVTYFLISALSYPFIALYNGCAALLRAMGNSRASMYVSAWMNGQNIVGNAIFVFGFHRGVDGVAWSSLLSRMVAAAIMLVLLHSSRNPVRLRGLLTFRFEPEMVARILRIGVPNSLENSFFQLGRVLLVSLISTFGTAQTAANAVANNIDNFGVIPAQAMGLALITVVGQCVGAEAWDQVRRYTVRLMKLAYFCTWGLNAVLLLSLPLILRLYSLSPETQWYATVLIFIHNGCAMLLWPMAFTMPNALRATGDVKVPMAISVSSMVAVRLGCSYLLGVHLGLGVIGVWLAMVGDWVVRILCFTLRARQVLWKRHPEASPASVK
ncbi:MATE family efflux transporter [uncultured Flavonifractor sp.]|uniref:MATE family efflux transporter n=1 Tax=uncultured Flavonifractor sp. TaxID=1193534 RepID=UPI003446B45A